MPEFPHSVIPACLCVFVRRQANPTPSFRRRPESSVMVVLRHLSLVTHCSSQLSAFSHQFRLLCLLLFSTPDSRLGSYVFSLTPYSLILCFSLITHYPSPITVFRLSTLDFFLLTLDFGPWTLDLGPCTLSILSPIQPSLVLLSCSL